MNQTRTLAAIMFTDIVGYTAIMAEDENRALSILESNREIHARFISIHGGQFIKEIGDGSMVTFPTASEAVFCALDIQKNIKPITN